MSVWGEFFGGTNVSKLKREAFELLEKYNSARFFKKFFLKYDLKSLLDEIDYQEGRKQFANRPYTFQSIKPANLKCESDCTCCFCWSDIRKNIFKM